MTETVDETCADCERPVLGIKPGEGTVKCRNCSAFGLPTRYVSESPEVPADD